MLLRGEIAVAGAEGEAVRVADDGANDQINRDVEIADHGAEHGDLGGVLLTEEGAVGGEDVEELADNRGDAAKVTGPGGAVEPVAEFAWVDEGAEAAGGVHVGCRWGEEEVDPFGFEQGTVRVEGARVFGEVLGGTKLGGVDEEGGSHEVAGLPGRLDERQVALMQRAHGGDETQGERGRGAEGAADSTGVCDGVGDPHAWTGSAVAAS